MCKKGLLLIELVCEELPINKLKYININFKKYIKYNLVKYNFNFNKIKVFVTIRRISCLIYDLNFFQKFKFKYKIIKGPKIKVSKKNIFNNNKLINWCKKIKLCIENIKYIKNNNYKYFFIKKKKKINSIKKLILIILKNVFLNLKKNNKTMGWNKNKYYFFRPINNIIIMFNNKVINIKLFGIKSNNILLENRFLNNKNIILNNSNKYIYILFKYYKIILDYKYKKNKIKNIIKNISVKNNILFFYKKSYFIKIISMIEWPVCVLCNFNIKYLFLPKDLIIFILNKYLGIVSFDKNNELTNNFIIILDIKNNNYKRIIKNYKNIIELELNEAKKLFLKDRKYYLISNLYKLKNVIFHKKIGNFLDKITRILFLSKRILYYLNYLNINIFFLNHVILLIKCDLVTYLYKYYNNLKGIIGMYYSSLDGESLNTSLIIKDHYNVNSNNIYSSIIFLIDKIDTLVGIFILCNFMILKKKNDPYGLRKISFLIIKKILKNKFYINIYNLIKYCIFLFNKKVSKNKILIIFNFINIRFFNYLNNILKYSKNIIYSFLYINKKKKYNFLDIKNRILIIIKYKKKKIFSKFINLYKRINNLLIKYKNCFNKFNIKFLIEKEEIILYKYIFYLYKKKKELYINYNYDKLLKYFFISINKINNFLNFVKIDVKDKNIKFNRLYLLNKINYLFKKFSNFKYYY